MGIIDLRAEQDTRGSRRKVNFFMGLGIKSGLQRMRSRVGSTEIERRGRTGFVGEAIQLISSRRRSQVAAPARDHWRFASDESENYDARVSFEVLRFLDSNASDIDRAAAQLADDESRNLLKQLLAFRALGPRRIDPPKDVEQMLAYYSRAATTKIGEGTVKLDPYEVALYRVPFEEAEIQLECWLGNVVATFFERQYYFARRDVKIAPREGDVVIDAGACFGDTALAFATTTGPSGQIHSFEPLPSQRSIYLQNRQRNSSLMDRLHVHEFALDKVSGRTLRFADAGAASRAVNGDAGVDVKTISIDDFVETAGLSRVDFIKMDIEGAESAALAGARATIRKYRPRLAISAYHSLADLTGLMSQIVEVEPSYRCFIDHHSIHAEETVLYAAAE